jgi:hypothetical protein
MKKIIQQFESVEREDFLDFAKYVNFVTESKYLASGITFTAIAFENSKGGRRRLEFESMK